ncbi:MAG: pyridoxal phosphate-dependent aminotransferase [Clostridia bacterium]|nr:pyridoxal phosphate-dependent aminotransferase [Clostridia bacterium]
MKYDFDTVYNRKGTNSVKYKIHPRYPEISDLIPMWIADMDFKTAPEIVSALRYASDEGIFGYTELDDAYYDLLIDWYKKRFDFNIKREWIVPCEGVMFAVAAAIRALSSDEDSVLILQPVYYPFANVINNNNRRLVVSELKNDGDNYFIDYRDLENKIINNNVKILLFCSPHNPVGRVWKREELERVTRICLKHNVIVISDEIHSDLVYKKHIPTASLSDKVADITVGLTSSTKTFNLAGIQGANLIIPNEKIRIAIENELRAQCAGGANIMSLAATKAAYQYGDKWLDELLVYLTRNIDYVIGSFEGTEIRPLTPQGTYLMWPDCRALGLNDRELEDFFIKKCGVWMNGGYIFGKGGSGFMRMNIACPRKTLEEAVFRIKSKIKENKYE